jgi:hypothetical protein
MLNGDNTKHLEKNSKKVDIWRDTKLRYLGYSNEIGEAFGTIYPKVYHYNLTFENIFILTIEFKSKIF